MNKKNHSQILDQVARENMRANTDLAPRILTQIQKGKTTTMQPRIKMFVTVLLVLLVLVSVLVSVPAVRAAIQSWFGYVPGIGLVTEGQIRVLAEPVSVTREGVKLTIEQVLVDSNQTTIQYAVDGLKEGMRDTKESFTPSGCRKDAILRLPEAELSLTGQTETGWVSGYQTRAFYPVIPSTINEVTFVLPCLSSALPGKAPEDWELVFRLIPAPPELTAFPLIEISTPLAATPTALPPMDASAGLKTDGISLVLDRAVELSDGYLLYASLHWENTGFQTVDVSDISTIHLLDANGQEVSYTFDWDETSNIPWQQGQRSFVIKTEPVLTPGPLTLVLDALSVDVSVPEGARFTFDLGANPQPNQVWEINKDIDVGYGHSVRVLRATYYLTNGTHSSLSFDMESKTGVTAAGLHDLAHPLSGAGGGGGGSFADTFSSGFGYDGALPTGPITVDVVWVSVRTSGHWQAEWTPPEPQAQVIPTPQAAACLTRQSWEEALRAHPTLPTGLSGTLAIMDVPPPDYHYQVSVVNLDGNNSKLIGLGSAPSLSPDKTRVVYTGPSVDAPADGLYITDLVSGSTESLFGTMRGDISPLWSPDGQWIAYTHGPSSGLIGAPGSYSMIVSSLDGRRVIDLTDGNEANYAAAWMPDSNYLLYTVPLRNGVSLRKIDIRNGFFDELFDLNYNGTIAVSPDGKRLAFEEMLPLDKYGLFVSDLDGSNRKLLSDGEPYVVTIPAWSPDGNWIITTVHDPNSQEQPILALILVNTCNIIPLPNLHGYVTSWLP